MLAAKEFFINLQRWWLFGLLFLIPISIKYVVESPFAISYLNLISVGYILIGLTNLLLGNLRLRKIGPPSLVWVIIGLLGAMAFALFFTDPLRNGLGLWTSRLLQPLLVGYFTYLLLDAGRLRVQEIIQAIFFSLIPLIVISLGQAFGVTAYRDPGRLTGPYPYPNTFARYVEIILLLSLPWLISERPKHYLWYWLIWTLGVLILLGSISYNGIVTFYLAALAVLWLIKLPKLTRRLLTGSLIAVGLIVAVNAPKLPKYQTSITDSRLTRLEFWQVALGAIGDNLWTGIGIKGWEKNYHLLVRDYAPWPPRNWGSAQPHNVFLDAWLKAGVPGFLAISALLFWPIASGWRYWRSRRDGMADSWLGLAVFGYGLAMLLFGLIDDPIWSDDTVPLLMVIYLTLGFAISRKEV